MEKIQYINQLIDSFMEGETTLQQEQELYDYFASMDVAPELEQYKELFLSLGELQNPEADVPVIQEPVPALEFPLNPASPVQHLPPFKEGRGGSPVSSSLLYLAACLIALIISGAIFYIHDDQNYCEAYIYNRHVTNQDEVMRELSNTLKSVDGASPSETVDNQLQSAFDGI